MTNIREANDTLWHLDSARKDVKTLLARNEELEKVYEAAKRMEEIYPPLFAPNHVKQQFDSLHEAIVAVETLNDE